MTDEQRITEIRARRDAATPGPWRTFPAKPSSPNPNDCGFGRAGVPFTRDELPCIGECWAETRRGIQDRMQAHANATFIAEAPADVDYLLALVETKDKALRLVRRERDEALARGHREGQPT